MWVSASLRVPLDVLQDAEHDLLNLDRHLWIGLDVPEPRCQSAMQHGLCVDRFVEEDFRAFLAGPQTLRDSTDIAIARAAEERGEPFEVAHVDEFEVVGIGEPGLFRRFLQRGIHAKPLGQNDGRALELRHRRGDGGLLPEAFAPVLPVCLHARVTANGDAVGGEQIEEIAERNVRNLFRATHLIAIAGAGEIDSARCQELVALSPLGLDEDEIQAFFEVPTHFLGNGERQEILIGGEADLDFLVLRGRRVRRANEADDCGRRCHCAQRRSQPLRDSDMRRAS